jgi:hypothetical protein
MPSERSVGVYALPHRGAVLLAKLGAEEDGFALEHFYGDE